MRIKSLVLEGMIALGLSVGGVGLLAGAASAHTPSYGETCGEIHASGTNYPEGSHVKFVVDGTTRLDKNFSPGFSDSTAWDQTKSHTWSLVISSPDHIGEVTWNGTQPACVQATTTIPSSAAPTTTTTIMPAQPAVVVEPTTTTTVPVVVADAPAPDESAAITTVAPAPTSTMAVPAVTTTTAAVLNALPTTGSEVTTIVLAGFAFLIGGIVMVVRSRRAVA
jgi:LPXTG-motif cell wall-anchored protein